MKALRLCLAITALAAGCRDVSYDDEDPTPARPDARTPGGGPDASLPSSGTVRAILMNRPAKKAAVSVSGVVVVGRYTSSKNAYAWVQDPGGGALSGIQIYCQKEGGCAAGYDLIDKLEEGDVLDVTGAYDEFQGAAEIVTPTIVKKSGKMAVAATTVTAAQVAKDASFATELDQVLVKLDGPVTVSSVTSEALARDCTSGTGKQYDGFEATVDGKTVNVGLGFYDTVGWCIAACGFECTKPITVGQTFGKLQGVLRMVSGNVRIDPAWPASLAQGGDPEPSYDGGTKPDAASRPDGGIVGNAGDGTVRSVTVSPPADGSLVALKAVVVVAVETSTSSASAYVQDLGGGENSGLMLFCGSACKAGLAGLRRGDVIDASGAFKNFNGNTPELTDVAVVPRGTRAEVVALTVDPSRVAKTVTPAQLGGLNGVLVQMAGPLDVASVEVSALESSSTCTGGARFRDGFEAAKASTGVYVSFFFNDNVGACVAGGCRTCDIGPITTAMKLDFLRGVARVTTGKDGPVVTVAPADEIDFPRAKSVRSIYAAGTPNLASVAVEGAVVVGYNAVSSTTGSLFLQDAGGGRWSGVQLFCTGATCNAAAAALQRGDVVNVSGKFNRYLGTTPEIESNLAPVKVGTSTARAAGVPGAAVDMTVAATSAEFQAWNQVYVKVSGALSVAEMTPADLQGTCSDAEELPRYEGFEMTDGASHYLVGDLFAPAYTVCVDGGCEPCANPVAGDAKFGAVSGVARVGRGGKIQLAPTADADLVAPMP